MSLIDKWNKLVDLYAIKLYFELKNSVEKTPEQEQRLKLFEQKEYPEIFEKIIANKKGFAIFKINLKIFTQVLRKLPLVQIQAPNKKY